MIFVSLVWLLVGVLFGVAIMCLASISGIPKSEDNLCSGNCCQGRNCDCCQQP